MQENNRKIKLTDCKVVFYTGPEDEKAAEFGTSVTIDVTDQVKRNAIEAFCKANNVGKKSDPKRGTANIKEYTNEKTGETTYQFTIKFNEKTKFGGLNGLSQKDLGYGSKINLIASAYDYTKFGGGTAMSANAIIVLSGGNNNNDADLEELMDDLGAEEAADETVVPF